MKKSLFVLVFGFFVLVGCAKVSDDAFDVNSIADLTTLQVVTTRFSEDFAQGKLSIEEAQLLLINLQDLYLSLTDTTHQSLENQFESIQKHIYGNTSFSLPFWAKRMWMKTPQYMVLDTSSSKQYTDKAWYTSTILVYTWTYELALEQAALLADAAWLHLSETFKQWQSIAQQKNVSYVSGLDIEEVANGVVYVSHDLFQKNVEYFLSIDVNKDWVLTIEATRYK